MKISAISRVRNEEHVIKDTLDHVANLVDDIYIYDDCSTDNTPDICESHPSVKKVIRGTEWADTSQGRDVSEGVDRQKPYIEAMKSPDKPDYIYCFDADEFADFDGIDFTHDYYRLRLFNFYATEEDKDKTWKERVYMGPEYRDITMLFKPTPRVRFGDREPGGLGGNGLRAGYVKEYGKAFSEKEWEDTCDYYINYFPRWSRKWQARKGKFIHTNSDFGRPLIKWEDRFDESKITRI
jgi:glycosyltransferase involved in cell wall biosynthesis